MTGAHDTPPVLLDGVLFPASEARARLSDPSFSHGDGLFETVRVIAGRPVALAAHLARLCASSEALRIPSPPAEVWSALAERLLAAAPPLPEAALRLQLSARPPGSTAPHGTTALSLRPLGVREATRRAGLALWTVPWARAPRGGLGGYKLTSWAATPIATRCHPRGADPSFEPVFTDGEALLEGGSTALALLSGPTLLLPPLDGRLLASVTRSRLADLAPSLGLRVTEGPLTAPLALAADAVLALSALLPVAPATHLDGAPLSLRAGAPEVLGAVVAALSAA